MKTVPSPKIGIVVSFPACLQLENERKVVLEQAGDDVSVSSK